MSFCEIRRRLLLCSLEKYIVKYSLNALMYAGIEVHKGNNVESFSDNSGVLILSKGDWIRCYSNTSDSHVHHNGEIVGSTSYDLYVTSDASIMLGFETYNAHPNCPECGKNPGVYFVICSDGYNLDYAITKNLSSNVSLTANFANRIPFNETYIASVIPQEGYQVGTVQVSMNGESSEDYYDESTNTIRVPFVGGDVVITVTATEIANEYSITRIGYAFTPASEGGNGWEQCTLFPTYSFSNNATWVAANQPYETTVTTSEDKFTSIVGTMGEESISDYITIDGDSASIAIPEVTGNVVIHLKARSTGGWHS